MIRFISTKHKIWVRKRNVSWRRFFILLKTNVIVDIYSNKSQICPILWIQFVPNLFRNREYFEKLKLLVFEV